MNETVSSIYKIHYDIWGIPQEYRGIKLYPLKLKDIPQQDLFYRTLGYPKNHIPDKKIIKMSYLKYLLIIVRQFVTIDNKDIGDCLLDLLKHVMQREDISFEVGYKTNEKDDFDAIDLRIMVGDIVLSESDFNNIREILLEQNGSSIDYVEEYNPELEERLNKINRTSDGVALSDEIFTFCALTGKTINEIENYTIYQFKIHMEKIIVLKEYDMYKPLEASGQITLKSGEIKHYLFRSQKTGRYGSIMIDKDKFIKDNELLNPE